MIGAVGGQATEQFLAACGFAGFNQAVPEERQQVWRQRHLGDCLQQLADQLKLAPSGAAGADPPQQAHHLLMISSALEVPQGAHPVVGSLRTSPGSPVQLGMPVGSVAQLLL